MQNSTKILIGVLIVVVLGASSILAFFMYNKMKENAMKKPATNYVIDESMVPKVSPTSIQATVPPVLSQPVANDVSGIDNEISILDQTATASDTSNVKTSDIENISQ